MTIMEGHFDPLATKGGREYRIGTSPGGYAPTIPGLPGTHPGGFGVPKNPKVRGPRTAPDYYDPRRPRRMKAPVPRKGSTDPYRTPKLTGGKLPVIHVPMPRITNPFLTGAAILGEIYSYEPLLGREGPTTEIKYSWDSADAVTYCPWAGDGVSPALGRVPITSISAQFNCGIFDMELSPRTGVDYELWHDCTETSPSPYNLFPGEVGSIIIVFNDLNLPPGIPDVGPVTQAQFMTDPGGVTATLPFPDASGSTSGDGAGYGGVGAPYPVPPRPYSIPSGVGPREHFLRKPKKNEVEGKKDVSLPTWVRFGKAAANYVSEIDDFVDAVFDALPRSAQFDQGVRPGDPDFNGIYGKTTAVWNYMRNGGEMSGFLGRAVRNVIENEVKDRVFGKIGQKIAKATRANPYWRSPVGPQAGGRYRPYASIGAS